MLGIGNDIIEIERIRSSIQRHGKRFIGRLFSIKEQTYCSKHTDPVPHFAARFSAKEAVVKAFGTGFGKDISWLDLEILNDPAGKPYVNFSPRLQERVKNTQMLVSISHCRLYVATLAIWVQKTEKGTL